MAGQHKRYEPDFKAEVALAILAGRGIVSIAEIARHHQVNVGTARAWSKQILAIWERRGIDAELDRALVRVWKRELLQGAECFFAAGASAVPASPRGGKDGKVPRPGTWMRINSPTLEHLFGKVVTSKEAKKAKATVKHPDPAGFVCVKVPGFGFPIFLQLPIGELQTVGKASIPDEFRRADAVAMVEPPQKA